MPYREGHGHWGSHALEAQAHRSYLHWAGPGNKEPPYHQWRKRQGTSNNSLIQRKGKVWNSPLYAVSILGWQKLKVELKRRQNLTGTWCLWFLECGHNNNNAQIQPSPWLHGLNPQYSQPNQKQAGPFSSINSVYLSLSTICLVSNNIKTCKTWVQTHTPQPVVDRKYNQ